MMEFLELGYPHLPASVTTLNLSRPDLPGPRGKEIDSGKKPGSGKPRGWPLTPETEQAWLRFEKHRFNFLNEGAL